VDKGIDSPGRLAARQAATIRPDRNVIARRVDAGTILIHLRTNRIYELNATGTRIWEMLGSGCDTAGMCSTLRQEFDVEEAEADRAIEETLAMLLAEGLIDSGSTH